MSAAGVFPPSSVAGGGVGGPGGGGVDDDLGHGDLVGLALARLDDLLRRLVVDGVEDQLRHREEHAQAVGDLRGNKDREAHSTVSTLPVDSCMNV